jgi:hypothetical protein
MKIIPIAIIATIISGNLAAQDINIVGTISHRLKATTSRIQHNKQSLVAEGVPSEIKLLKVELSDKAKQALELKAKTVFKENDLLLSNTSANLYEKYPAKVELGMNDVPVLNQGNHGSCVTFAITAAVDAALNQGDYVSQLCQLQLGNYLATQGYGRSGWNGSSGNAVLTQMDTFGLVNKQQEARNGCGGLNEYPLIGEDPTSSISLEEFHQMSEHFSPYVDDQKFYPGIAWSPILDVYQALADRTDTNKILANVKKSLAAGDRVTFGVLLVDLDLGVVGAVGSNKAANDSWVLTTEIARDAYLKGEFAGHEMIITGYDDNAVAKDENGHEHRGLLTLRNSWGEKMGDHGNFYMSYDFFKLFIMEVERIRS